MATPPQGPRVREYSPRRRDDSAAVGHARPRRGLRAPLPASSWVLNGLAIGIAVVITPVLTTSSASTAVPAAAPSAQPVVVSTATVPVDPSRFSTQPPQEVPDPTTDRDAMDFDDTLAPPPPGKAVKSNGSDFVSPVPGAITGGFGQRFHPILHYWRMHNGVDMHADCGTPVVAAYRGTVIEAGWNGGYGNLVVIDHGSYHGKQLITKYAHLSRIGVRVGQHVDTAQGIALSGTTGLSTGCHLHFEVKQNGAYGDPAPFLTGKPSPRPDGPIQNLGPTTSPRPTTTPTPRPSASKTPSATPSPSPSKTPKPKPSESATPTPSTSPSPSTSSTPTPTPSDTPSEQPSKSSSPEPSHSAEPSESATRVPAPQPSHSAGERSTASAQPSPSESTTP